MTDDLALQAIYQYVDIAKCNNAKKSLRHYELLDHILIDVVQAIALLRDHGYVEKFSKL